MKFSLDGLTENCKSQKEESMNLKTDQQKLPNLKNREKKHRASMATSPIQHMHKWNFKKREENKAEKYI